MSNYTQSTNFATKDALPSGDPLKIVKGTEINTEFNNISVAVATKADLVSPTFSGSPVLPTGTTGVTQSVSDDSTALATTAFVQDVAAVVKAAIFPVGAIYTAIVSTNPGTLLGFGTWTAFGAGRTLVGLDAGNALFDTAEETGGSADSITVSHTHTATVTDPGHVHTPTHRANGEDLNNYSSDTNYALWGSFSGSTNTSSMTSNSASTGVSVSNASTGSSGTNANLQPYVVVYMWKRTA